MASSSPHRTRRSPSPHRSKKRSPSPHRSSRRRSPSPHRSSRRRSPSPRRSSKRSPSPTRKRRHASRSVSRERSHTKSRRRSRSSSQSHKSRRRSPSSSSSSSSEDDRRKRREHKKHKKEKKHKKSKKKSKKSSKLSAVGDQWGKYGIIHDADIFSKEAEFQAWLIEVKNANVEILSNIKRKEMFSDFMEDYNTATMPHEKFYSLHKWERRQEALRMGEKPMISGEAFDFRNDEEKLRMQHRQAARAVASRQPTLQLSQDQIKELVRVNRERVEADRMRKMGLKPKESMGVRYEEEEQ
ncbi:hypothetical protein INT47_008305 [Mucor saturninus]|uniref:Uncharacterized protein n=1 Tax=Mucor saturninus TaxID=64648 RepID=A0A8H7REF9_9FUNG|nr:hypothetical protein INT47_008305 [Mucor saturninus]